VLTTVIRIEHMLKLLLVYRYIVKILAIEY